MSDSPSLFYDLYPKDPIENLRWRIRCRERALEDEAFRDAIYEACMLDPLFWLAFACWGFDPRSNIKISPFVPHAHQETVFVAMDKAIDDSEKEERAIDVLLDKARAQGGTLGYLWLDLRRWLRDPMFSAGYVTRNEALIDSKTDSDTLFWKLDWAVERLPFWMVPAGYNTREHRSYSNHSMLNPVNGASLVGYAAGQDVGTGGRKTVFTCDEFGAKDFVSGGKDYSILEALHDVTNCLRFVSARYIDSGAFHEACEDPDSARSGVHLILAWQDNPMHGKHSYIVKQGIPVAVKPEDQPVVTAYHKAKPDLRRRLERKGFKFEDRVRSPWYDMRCLRPTANPRLIASQLDRDPRGAVGKVFMPELLDRVKKKHCKHPVWRGTPVFDSETLKLTGLIKRDDGPLKLWFQPGPDDSCPLGPFTVGCDVAIGSDGAYSSNSVASGIDDRTGEQVMEYAVNGVPMILFGRKVVGLCLWLRNAMLGWEDAGMCAPFAKEVVEVLLYGHIYYREVAEIGKRTKTRKTGWHNGSSSEKQELFEKMALAMESDEYIIRSDDLIRECGEYELDEKSKIIHVPTKTKGGEEKAHGDRCIAAGVAWLIYSEGREGIGLDKGDDFGQSRGYGSILWCEQQERKPRTSDDPDYGLRDILQDYQR